MLRKKTLPKTAQHAESHPRVSPPVHRANRHARRRSCQTSQTRAAAGAATIECLALKAAAKQRAGPTTALPSSRQRSQAIPAKLSAAATMSTRTRGPEARTLGMAR